MNVLQPPIPFMVTWMIWRGGLRGCERVQELTVAVKVSRGWSGMQGRIIAAKGFCEDQACFNRLFDRNN